MKNKKKTQKVQLMFFNMRGKWKYEAVAEVSVDHYMWMDEYKQDIVNTQNGIQDGWQNDRGYYIVTSAIEDENGDYEGFHEALWLPGDFAGIKKQG